jgi:hypothetical protein
MDDGSVPFVIYHKDKTRWPMPQAAISLLGMASGEVVSCDALKTLICLTELMADLVSAIEPQLKPKDPSVYH